MDEEIKNLFKREVARYEYLYAKANTKSKKKEIAFDLIFFEDMYNSLLDEKVDFPWSDDVDLVNVRIETANGLINNVLREQDLLKEIFENNFNIFIEEGYSLYTDYSKNYHKLGEEMMQKNMAMFYRSIDKTLVDRFKNKLENLDIFINNTIDGGYDGLTYPLEVVDKNVIMFVSGKSNSVEDARILVHELGHDFEFENAKRSGEYSVWSKIAKTIYFEVCPSFFEYAFINYLIDNKIYLEDALMLRRRYLNQLFYYLSYTLSLINIDDLKIDFAFGTLLEDENVVNYANELLDKMNSYSERYKVGDTINFRSSFIYAMGRLMGVYLYEIYKENSKEFLSDFRKILIDYKYNNFESFEKIGLTKEVMSNGKVLRRVLRDANR